MSIAFLWRLRRFVINPVTLGGCLLIGAGLLALAGHPIACPFHAATGLPCPTCGSTRAGLRLLHLDLIGALRENPLVTCALLAAPLLTAAHACGLRLRHLRPRVLTLGAIAALALNWFYLLRFGRH